MSVVAINSKEWWDAYFEKHWDDNLGSAQTRYFMEELLENLPAQESALLKSGGLSVLDWGCAFGQGVEVLAESLPDCRVSGIDFSERAIEEARKRYSSLRFLHTHDGRIPETFDVVITSNCIEHFTEPLEVCRTLVAASKKLFIATVPYNESPMIDQHFSQFREESFPESLGDFRRLDCRIYESHPDYWAGKQMLVVYGSLDYFTERMAGEIAGHGEEPVAADSGFIASLEHGEMIRRVSEECARTLTKLVPPGGSILEFESGPCWLAMAIARMGTHKVSILSHSQDFLVETQDQFAAENLPVELIRDNPRGYGAAAFDLVFSASMMDDRDPEDGVALLNAMACRTRGYLACLEPNPLSYWHGLYRMARGVTREETSGRPRASRCLVDLFDAPRLPLLGQAFLGLEVSEALVSHLRKVPLETVRRILKVHRSGIVTPAVTNYFRMSLSTVTQAPVTLPDEWIAFGPEAKGAQDTGKFAVDVLGKKRLSDGEEDTEDTVTTDLSTRREAPTLATLARDLDKKEKELEQLQKTLAEKDQQITHLNMLNDQFSRSLSGVIVQKLWWFRRILAPDGTRRHYFLIRQMERARGFLGKLRLAPPIICRWMRKRGLPAPMTWYAYAFDRFKRERHAKIPNRLEGLRGPGKPGLASIVLPVYNGERYLAEALDSILAQKYTNFELIVVDDGSSDSTPKILAEYAAKEPRMKVITQENQKLPKALTNGFQAAKGEFLTWTSVDNRLKPDLLLRMIQCLNQNPHWDMIYGNEDIIGDDGKPLQNSSWFSGYQKPMGSEHVYLPVDPSELNTWANNYVGGAFIYRDRVRLLLGDYSPWRFGTEDYDYWMRVNALMNLRHTDFPEPMYDYRFHEESLTSMDEELGITKNRPRLMIFDDFRRDFCLGPMAWIVDAEDDSKSTRGFMIDLNGRIQTSDHVLIDLDNPVIDEFPRLWMPMAYLKVVSAACAEMKPPDKAPSSALKVMVVTGSSPELCKVSPEWDLCIATDCKDELPRLADSRRGWLAISDMATFFSAIDVRTRSDHLALIEAEIEVPVPSKYRLSVIVCTLRRVKGLVETLESVFAQDLPREDFEVIVVNNDYQDKTVPDAVARLRDEHFTEDPERLKLVTCPLLGLSHARNAGMAEARGEVLLFLDDDAIAREGCLLNMWRAFLNNPKAGVIGGKILVKPPEPPPKWLKPDWLLYWSHFEPGYDEYREVLFWWEFPWGADWAVRRKAMLEIGGFRTRYGRKGTDFGGGEETTSARLIQQLGYTIGVASDSQVIHAVDPDRFTLQHVRQTIRAALNVHYQAQRDLYFPFEVSLVRTFVRMCGSFVLALAPVRQDRYERFRKLWYARAQLGLLKRQASEWFYRCRKTHAGSG